MKNYLLSQKEDILKYKNLLCIEVILCLLGCGTLLISHQQTWFIIFFLITLLQLIIHIVSFFQLEKKLITFPVIFFILSYVFNYGHIPIKAFNMDFGNNVLFPLWYIRFDVYKEAAIFSLLSQTMLFIGLFFFYKYMMKKHSNSYTNHAIFNISLKKIQIIGIICFLIGIIPTLYIDISRLILFFQGGYTNTFNLNVHDFVEVIANFFNFSVFALIIGFSNNKRIANTIFCSTIIYKVIMMSSGGRGESIVFLVGLFIVWENLVYNLSGKQIIYLILVGYFGLVLLNFIANVRNISGFHLNEIVNVFLYSLTDNQIVMALSEFGSTFSTVCFTIASKPGPTFGLNYILPIILVLPNIGGFNANVVNQMIYTNHINTYNQPIGGSYIGELFYSFHWAGFLFALVLGILLGYIYYRIVISRKNKKYFLYLLATYITPLLFFWIRGYFGAIYREYIWHCGFAILLVIVFEYLSKKYKKGELKWLK